MQAAPTTEHRLVAKLGCTAIALVLANPTTVNAGDEVAGTKEWVNHGEYELEGYVDAQHTSIQPGTPKFSGCDFNRWIILRGGATLLCHSRVPYFGSASRAIVLQKGPHFKIIVDGRVFDGLSR
jgi:hypothetical protein